jgi:cytochrome b6-f complex iron-sulfur subunit
MNTIQDNQSTPIGRRKFIQLLLGFSIVSTFGGIVAPIVAYLFPAKSQTAAGAAVDVGAVDTFGAGSGTVVSVNSKPVLVVNTKAGGLKAFSAICTHLGCIVAWDDKKGVIHCPCHEGIFNPTTGAVVSGPPPAPLAGYELAVKDGKVMIGKPQGQIYGS